MHFFIHALDKPDALPTRLAHYEAHKAYLAKAPLKMLVSGPLVADDGETMIGSCFLVEAASKDEVMAFHNADPFKAAVFGSGCRSIPSSSASIIADPMFRRRAFAPPPEAVGDLRRRDDFLPARAIEEIGEGSLGYCKSLKPDPRLLVMSEKVEFTAKIGVGVLLGRQGRESVRLETNWRRSVPGRVLPCHLLL